MVFKREDFVVVMINLFYFEELTFVGSFFNLKYKEKQFI